MKGYLGKKLGMTNIFDARGNCIPVTLIEAGPCYITQIKSIEKDGYSAVQIGYISKKEKHTSKPLLGNFKKANTDPLRYLREFKPEKGKEYKIGDEIKVDVFNVGETVNVVGVSKGKGFAGVMKRFNFKGGPKSHGQSDRLRAGGSIGASASPSKVIKGMKMPGRMGGKRVTLKNLKIINIDRDNNLIYIKGAVPGARNTLLEIRKV